MQTARRVVFVVGPVVFEVSFNAATHVPGQRLILVEVANEAQPPTQVFGLLVLSRHVSVVNHDLHKLAHNEGEAAHACQEDGCGGDALHLRLGIEVAEANRGQCGDREVNHPDQVFQVGQLCHSVLVVEGEVIVRVRGVLRQAKEECADKVSENQDGCYKAENAIGVHDLDLNHDLVVISRRISDLVRVVNDP